MPITPIPVSCGAGYNGTSGSGFSSTPAPSPTLRGSGYNFPAVIATTHVPRECAEDDNYYFLLRAGGDPALTGPCTIDFYYESNTPVTFTDAQIQWDDVDGIFGIPVSPRPKATFSGLYQWYAIVKPTNGYEYMISGEVWHNRATHATGYIDRHARAAYVAGADYNGSGAPGTTTTLAKGTAATPNPNLNAALNFMTGASDGGYIYVKGLTDESVNIGSARSGPFPTEVRPWPGFTKQQTLISKVSRIAGVSGGINFQHSYIVMNGVQIDPDKFTNMQARVTSLGFRNCDFIGTTNGGLDGFGTAKGHIASVSGVSPQDFFVSNGGQHNWAKNCTFTGFIFTGMKTIVNTLATLAWDAAAFSRNILDYAWWNYRVSQPGNGVARYHYEDDLTVAAVSPLTAGWCEVTFSGAPTLINNLFENRLQVLTGALAGQTYGAQTVGAGSYASPGTNMIAMVASNVGGNYATYPRANTLYVALRDLAALGLAVGDRVRVYNIPHPDTFQFIQMTSNTDVPGRNIYAQKYITNAASTQGMLVQGGTMSGMTGTVSVSGNTATFSASITIPRTGIVLSITNAGTGTNKQYKYARFTSSGTGTAFTLETTDLDGVVGATYSVSHTVTGVLMENCIFHKFGSDDEITQWQHGAAGWTIQYCTFLGRNSTNNGGWSFRSNSAGFGLAGIKLSKSIFDWMDSDALAGFPTLGIALDRNHFIGGTARGTNTSAGSPAFDATLSFTSGYKPTANVQSDPAPAIPFDIWGNARQAGDYIGAVARATVVTPPANVGRPKRYGYGYGFGYA